MLDFREVRAVALSCLPAFDDVGEVLGSRVVVGGSVLFVRNCRDGWQTRLHSKVTLLLWRRHSRIVGADLEQSDRQELFESTPTPATLRNSNRALGSPQQVSNQCKTPQEYSKHSRAFLSTPDPPALHHPNSA